MFLPDRELARLSFGVSIAAYAAGILLACTVTALGSYRVMTVVLSELAPTKSPRQIVASVAAPTQRTDSVPHPTPRLPARQAFMTPLHAAFPNLPKTAAAPPRLASPALFGSSSRYSGRSSRRDRDADDDEDRDDDDERGDRDRPREFGTYRTLCVRLCDGYYFPISFSATRDRFARDAKTCESSCGGQARLFVYRNPGADVEDMVDLKGQPYRKLSTAFVYRTEYVPACRCKPNPWDSEARDRHRVYAQTAAKRKGNKQAALELETLGAKMKRDRSAPAVEAPAPAAPADAGSPVAVVPSKARGADQRRRRDATADRTGRMGLGAQPRREARERPARAARSDGEWMSRALGRIF